MSVTLSPDSLRPRATSVRNIVALAKYLRCQMHIERMHVCHINSSSIYATQVLVVRSTYVSIETQRSTPVVVQGQFERRPLSPSIPTRTGGDAAWSLAVSFSSHLLTLPSPIQGTVRSASRSMLNPETQRHSQKHMVRQPETEAEAEIPVILVR